MRDWLRKNKAVAALAASQAAIVLFLAAQTNYLGTVFIADTTTPSHQLVVNADGSINADVTSGGVTWPAVGSVVISSGNNSPTGVAEIDGDCLKGVSSAWAAAVCTPAGGSNTQLQYNNSGAFGGIAGATTDGTVVSFANSDLALVGSSTGKTTFTSDNAGASNFTLHFPAANDTIALVAATQTLTGKTLTAPGITGCTAQGSLPYINSSNVLGGCLGPGTAGQVLISQGASANPAFSGPPFATFVALTNASGTWTPPANVNEIYLCGVAGGGQGGGVGTGAAATASGGAGGETGCFWYAVTPGVGISYTVGAGGSSSGAGNNNGQAGGNNTFGTITLAGGPGGIGSASGNAAVVSATTLAAAQHTFAPSSSVLSVFNNFPNGAGGSAGTGGTGGRVGGANSIGWGAGGVGGNNATGGACSGIGSAGGGAGDTSSNSFAGGAGCAGEWTIQY